MPVDSSEPLPDSAVIERELSCEKSFDLDSDVNSLGEGHGSICIIDPSGGPQAYIMEYGSYPAAVFDDRVWGTGDPTMQVRVYSNGYIVAPISSTLDDLGGIRLTPAEWKNAAIDISPSALLADPEMDCRSVLATALTSDYSVAVGLQEDEDWVDPQMFDAGAGEERSLILAARDDLISGREQNSLEYSKENPAILDYAAESFSAKYGDEIIDLCVDLKK